LAGPVSRKQPVFRSAANLLLSAGLITGQAVAPELIRALIHGVEGQLVERRKDLLADTDIPVSVVVSERVVVKVQEVRGGFLLIEEALGGELREHPRSGFLDGHFVGLTYGSRRCSAYTPCAALAPLNHSHR